MTEAYITKEIANISEALTERSRLQLLEKAKTILQAEENARQEKHQPAPTN